MMKKDNTKQNVDENKAAYLTLIQEPISRTSTTSAIFKGFAATTFAGFSVLEAKTIFVVDGAILAVEDQPSILLLFLSIISISMFMMLDIYYLQLERKFRYLYKCVNSGTHPCDYGIEPIRNKEKEAKATICDCMKSPSIWMFYTPMIFIEIIVYFLKVKGVV